MKDLMIEKRFCGPPSSANGGYACGLLAAHIDGNAEITLLAPPPLGQRLGLVAGEHDVDARKDETTRATGRRVRIDVPEIPLVDFSAARDAVRRAPCDESSHPLPMCGPAHGLCGIDTSVIAEAMVDALGRPADFKPVEARRSKASRAAAGRALLTFRAH